MAVTTNLNSNTKSNGKITEMTLNNKLKSNTFLRGFVLPFEIKKEVPWPYGSSLCQKIFFDRNQLHVRLRDAVGRGEEMLCDCSRFGFGVSVI